MLFGAVGFGYFMYGRKQSRTVPLLCGIGLFVMPWIISSLFPLLAAGAVLMALPYFFRF
jgi:hypothetical protein